MAQQNGGRMSGLFGSAWRVRENEGNLLLADVVEVSLPIQFGRVTIPIVGTRDTYHKMGQITREGTLQVHKYDSSWELELFALLSQSDDDRRAARDAGHPLDPSFTLIVKLDDPEAYGGERWQVEGCRLWNFDLGFNSADEVTARQFQLTWDSERPLSAFRKVIDGKGQPRASYAYGGAR